MYIVMVAAIRITTAMDISNVWFDEIFFEVLVVVGVKVGVFGAVDV